MASPEIAMANGGTSRRMACKLCRDRKVRCGGEQPVCEKCRRSGEQCVYLPTQKPSKADLAETVETLQNRLDEAEALIDRLRASSGGTSETSPPSHVFDTPANLNVQNAAPPNTRMSSGVHVGHVTDPINGSSSHDRQGPQPPGSGSGEPPRPIVHEQTPGGDNELPLLPIDGYMNIDPSNFDFYPQDGFGPQRGIDEDTGAAILNPVTRFSSAIFRNQAETLVMASVVADYIAWLRKAPPGGGIPTAKESPVYLGMLDNLEIRLRELCEMSQSRSAEALKELVSALGAIAPPGGTMAASLGSLEEDLQKEAQERAEAFRSRYNPCALLSQQAHKTSE